MLNVKQGAIEYHFWVFGMNLSGIEPWSPRPIPNSLPTRPKISIHIYKIYNKYNIYTYTYMCVYIVLIICTYIYVCVCVCVCVHSFLITLLHVYIMIWNSLPFSFTIPVNTFLEILSCDWKMRYQFYETTFIKFETNLTCSPFFSIHNIQWIIKKYEHFYRNLFN